LQVLPQAKKQFTAFTFTAFSLPQEEKGNNNNTHKQREEKLKREIRESTSVIRSETTTKRTNREKLKCEIRKKYFCYHTRITLKIKESLAPQLKQSQGT
jgi:hypothetical protein